MTQPVRSKSEHECPNDIRQSVKPTFKRTVSGLESCDLLDEFLERSVG